MTKHSENLNSPQIAGKEPSNESMALAAETVGRILGDSNSEALAEAKANWIFGEWQALADIDLAENEGNADLSTLAALKAVGYQQLNNMPDCKRHVELARDLGCGNQVINKLLLSGVHNTLAKIAALRKETDAAKRHFEAALDGTGKPGSSSDKLAIQARFVRELANLGLLDDAAGIVKNELSNLSENAGRPSKQTAQIAILKSEMELINHQLLLAHKKSVLFQESNPQQTIVNADGSINIQALKNLSTSQIGQDLWVLEKTNYKRGGFFVEFGATDGVLLSNTYILEKLFDWKGICAEPNPEYFKKLEVNRNCVVSDACIGAVSGDVVKFILANEFGGIADLAVSGKHADKVAAYQEAGASIEIETTSLHDFLLTENAPRVIDYLSIDTEGSEFEILKSFPFHEWAIEIISVEHNFEAQREDIYALLTAFDYTRIENQWDDYYLKNH
ncbi:MAG: FkbM family methyltransferase [Halioglobus sp.]